MTIYKPIGESQARTLIFIRESTKPIAGMELAAKIFPMPDPDLSTVGRRIAWLIAQSGLGQGEFAARIGVGADTMSKWVNDRLEKHPHKSNLRSIAALFGTPLGAMMSFVLEGGAPPQLAPIQPEHPSLNPRTYVASESAHRIPAGTIPVINRVPAGNGMALTDQDFAPNFSHETVDAGPWASPGSVAFFVQGDSMAPDFLDGDLVIADPNRPCADHCFAIVQFGPERGEENKLRRVLKTPNGTLLLPSNPKYNKEIVDPEAIVSLLRVVELRRPVQ